MRTWVVDQCLPKARIIKLKLSRSSVKPTFLSENNICYLLECAMFRYRDGFVTYFLYVFDPGPLYSIALCARVPALCSGQILKHLLNMKLSKVTCISYPYAYDSPSNILLYYYST